MAESTWNRYLPETLRHLMPAQAAAAELISTAAGNIVMGTGEADSLVMTLGDKVSLPQMEKGGKRT